jgi:hypothetical protein
LHVTQQFSKDVSARCDSANLDSSFHISCSGRLFGPQVKSSSGQHLIPQDAQLHTSGRYMYMYICTARLPDSHLPVSTDTEHHTSAVPRTSRRHIAGGTHSNSPKLFWNAVARNKPDKLDKRVGHSIRICSFVGTWPGLCSAVCSVGTIGLFLDLVRYQSPRNTSSSVR